MAVKNQKRPSINNVKATKEHKHKQEESENKKEKGGF